MTVEILRVLNLEVGGSCLRRDQRESACWSGKIVKGRPAKLLCESWRSVDCCARAAGLSKTRFASNSWLPSWRSPDFPRPRRWRAMRLRFTIRCPETPRKAPFHSKKQQSTAPIPSRIPSLMDPDGSEPSHQLRCQHSSGILNFWTTPNFR